MIKKTQEVNYFELIDRFISHDFKRVVETLRMWKLLLPEEEILCKKEDCYFKGAD